ncbi:hypothetical protein BXZ70DRAFT_919414 [Cristinia sonorae]|uniref:FAD/NAD(P)-binding domain-containing protein n=1 Tax=Cristinia sonorae TaxID=1940300 RepID=A0A8K0UUU9_9AGAR|nr:hypothetical protein BXZ70DRAFT_919414 [Cristinia sonorae]
MFSLAQTFLSRFLRAPEHSSTISEQMPSTTSTKTVVVLGASYGGYTAAQHLAEQLPNGWRVIAIDRNSHFNHVYVFPRFTVLPGHSHKGFITYNNRLGNPEGESRHILLNASVTNLGANTVTLSRSFPELGIVGEEPTLAFDYAIYALGSDMPGPINVWGPALDEENVSEGVSAEAVAGEADAQPWAGPPLSEVTTATQPKQLKAVPMQGIGSKAAGVEWQKRAQKYIEKAPSVLVVGGGALGIQFATDIADIYPDKTVTLLHSRERLLPRFHEAMHTEIVAALSSLNVNTILGDRLDLSYPDRTERDNHGVVEHVVRTVSGREIRAAIILLCTGQRPNSDFVKSIIPDSVISDGSTKGLIRVNHAMQIGVPAKPAPQDSADDFPVGQSQAGDDAFDIPYPHLFAVGDVADTFGAVNAGYTAFAQALVAANNILKLIQAEETSSPTAPELEQYQVQPPGIKMSIGRHKSLFQIGTEVGTKSDCPDDLEVVIMWNFLLKRQVTEEEMYE